MTPCSFIHFIHQYKAFQFDQATVMDWNPRRQVGASIDKEGAQATGGTKGF